MKIRLRDGTADDHAYVATCWLGGWRWDSRLHRKAYDRGLVDRVLTDPSTKLRLAVDADDVDHIVGFSVVTGDVLHYVHVRKEHWGMGCCRVLLKGVGSLRCWYANAGARFVARCCELRYDPLCLMD